MCSSRTRTHEIMERVLVTGASGYIASHAVQQLLVAGYNVRGTVRSLANESKVKHLKNLCPDAKHPLELVEADLTSEQCWISAVKDCDYVLHIASPFPMNNPRDESELIIPAVEGTRNVLRAASTSTTVKRVVLTSSVAAIRDFAVDTSVESTEADWPSEEGLDPYSKSKLLAERAAWDFMSELKSDADRHKFELAVINPGYVLGPLLSGASCTSAEAVLRLMGRGLPLIPRMNFAVVDVRDVAAAHIVAMTLPEASGERHILVTDNMWMADMAQILTEEFKPQGYSPSSTVIPHLLFKVYAKMDSAAARIAPYWGKIPKFNNSKMRMILNVTPHSTRDTVVDMVYSLIEGDFIKKTSRYKGKVTSSAAASASQS